MRNVVITGTTSGIGYGAAKEFVRHGYRVFGGVLEPTEVERLSDELGEGFVPLLLDVTDQDAVRRFAAQVEEVVGGEGGLAGLVNNAGMAVLGPLMHQPPEEIRRHFEVNVFGLISVTRALLPLLGAKQGTAHAPGRIINVSSTGGKVAAPFMGAYVGTKHAVEGISDSLRREMMPYGIDVIVVRPGSVKTEIWTKDLAAAEGGRYCGTDYADAVESFANLTRSTAADGYTPKEIGRLLRRTFESKRPRTKYVFARGVRGRLNDWIVPAYLPDHVFDRLVGKQLGLLRREAMAGRTAEVPPKPTRLRETVSDLQVRQ